MAERMNEAGVGRKTFNLELDSEGKVLVHTFPYPLSEESLKNEVESGLDNVYDRMLEKVGQRFPSDHYHVVLFTKYENKTARGVGNPGMALIATSDIFQWPKSI